MKDKLAILDLDGTLFDTEPVNYFSYRDALAPEGVELERAYFAAKCSGGYYKDFLPPLLGAADEAQLERIHARKQKAYSGYLDRARSNRQLLSLIEAAAPEYLLALVTTASRKNVDQILTAFSVQGLFDLLLTQEDVVRKKPDPQGFLLAMEHFGIPPERTVIFEDSPAGIEAGRRTGAAVFSVAQF